MQRQPSDSSTASTSRLRRYTSRLRKIGIKSERSAPLSPRSDIAPVQKFIQELDAAETVALPVSDSVEDVSDDPSYQQLRDNIRRLRGASLGVNGVDSTFSVYSRFRGQSLELCKSLAKKSKLTNRVNELGIFASSSTYDAQSPTGEHGERNDSGSPNAAWVAVIHDFRKYQEGLLEHLRESIASTYKKYEVDATSQQKELLFSDREFRNLALSRMETSRNTRSSSETSAYWHKYVERFHNYDQLKVDLLQTELLCVGLASEKSPNVPIREYDIAANGDTVLEFANSVSEIHPILRFRVSSYMLIEASPFFARILSSSHSDSNSPLEMLEGFPPPPLKQVCRDGTEVKVYRMPQFELNRWEALTTLLHAAHMHNDHIPREVKFYEFVSIAEVCLRYQCTGPLEMAVEYRWLPQWIHKTNEELPDGMLLITYVFGLRRLFHRASKSAILNIKSDVELERKELWPKPVKDKIAAVREAKLAQIYASCAGLMREYIKIMPPMQASSNEAGGALSSTPKCPKGLHQCDAANLGWLMLVYNELGILAIVMEVVNGHFEFAYSGISIGSLVQRLWQMPSPPQLHSGICDYAPAFRNAISDISNSITGLSFREVTGIDGWALSKRHDLRTKFSNDAIQEIFELPAPMEQNEPDPVDTTHERISLRILSHLDDLQDLHATAMVNKSFYSAFKKNELTLMRNLIKVGKRKTTMLAISTLAGSGTHQQVSATTLLNGYESPVRPDSTYMFYKPLHVPALESSDDDVYGTTPPTSPPRSYTDLSISTTEIHEILYPNEEIANGNRGNSVQDLEYHDLESNAKFLSGDIVHVDKSLVIEGRKHLRDEQDRNLRMVPHPVTRT